jgi:hypothetical protein
VFGALKPLPDQPPEPIAMSDWLIAQAAPCLSISGLMNAVVRFQAEIDRDRDESGDDENDADQVTQRQAADEKQREQDRAPDDGFAKIGLQHDQQTGRADDHAAQEELQHRVHVAKLVMAEKEREHHDARNDGELGRLKIDRSDMQPTARPVNFRADEFRQDEEDDSREIHRERAPTDPSIIDQAGDHEREKPDGDPVGLLAPKFLRDGVLPHVGGTVNSDDAEDAEREHRQEQHPVQAEQFSQQWSHRD